MSDITYTSDASGSTHGYVGTIKVAAVWGPAIGGDWFVKVGNWPEARRVPSKEEALSLLPMTIELACARCPGRAVDACCSSHKKPLCHRCYRQTHFVEVCGEGCPECAAEGLSVRLVRS